MCTRLRRLLIKVILFELKTYSKNLSLLDELFEMGCMDVGKLSRLCR